MQEEIDYEQLYWDLKYQLKQKDKKIAELEEEVSILKSKNYIEIKKYLEKEIQKHFINKGKIQKQQN